MSLINRILNPTTPLSLYANSPLAVFNTDPFFRDPFFRSFEENWVAGRTPALDVVETPESYVVKADVPGYSKDNIDVDVEGGVLNIRGKWVKEEEQKDAVHLARERSESSFQRSISLGTRIDPTKIKASLKDGILEVTVPKNEVEQVKKISIE